MAEATPEAKTTPKRIRLDKIRKGIRADEAALRRDKASQPERVRLFANEDGAKLAKRGSEIAARWAALQKLEQAQREARAKRRVEARLAEMGTLVRQDLRDQLGAELLVQEMARIPADAGSKAKRKRGRPKGSRTRSEPRNELDQAAAELHIDEPSAELDQVSEDEFPEVGTGSAPSGTSGTVAPAALVSVPPGSPSEEITASVELEASRSAESESVSASSPAPDDKELEQDEPQHWLRRYLRSERVDPHSLSRAQYAALTDAAYRHPIYRRMGDQALKLQAYRNTESAEPLARQLWHEQRELQALCADFWAALCGFRSLENVPEREDHYELELVLARLSLKSDTPKPE